MSMLSYMQYEQCEMSMGSTYNLEDFHFIVFRSTCGDIP